MALAYSMDKIGPMCRTAADCGLVLQTIAGHDPEDAGTMPETQARYTRPPENRTESLRLGWLTNQWKELAVDVTGPVNEARKVLESLPAMKTTEIALPDGPWEAAAGTIVSVEGASAFRDLIHSGKVAELNDPAGKIGGYLNEEISASDFLLAQRVRRILQTKIDSLFQQLDVLVTATLPVTAPKIDANLDLSLSFADPIGGIGNICGLPAISVPCGFGNGGLPVGLQFLARPLDDHKVVQAARRFQENTDWHLRHPKIA
jgi:aspartyl-tRNA(Asn)/glutamyl-tRNA(Gln) amidotransferase subunit A